MCNVPLCRRCCCVVVTLVVVTVVTNRAQLVDLEVIFSQEVGRDRQVPVVLSASLIFLPPFRVVALSGNRRS